MQTFTRNLQPYTAFFCEENVWQLANRLIAAGYDAARLQVLLISNRYQSVFMLEQRSAPPGAGTAWDYHVALRILGQPDLILDADTRLPYPSKTRDYLRHSFPPQNGIPARFQARIRVIGAADYVRRFDSDRSHMRGKLPVDAFPAWPPIRAVTDPIPLSQYRNMDAVLDDDSRVLTIDELLRETG